MMMMKWGGIGVLLIGCAMAGACVSTGVSYHETVSMGTTTPVARPGGWDQPFYDDLAPHGRWVFVTGPGWVWSPDNVEVGWRPYQVGHWVYTDYGWTWASDEEWGWAVYHYGRWHLDNSFGWVWVPGTEWGPAWVAWHEGGGYVGWAPLPWQVTVRAGVGLDWGGVSVSISPSWWCFASSRHLVDPQLRTRIVPVERNTTLIRVTQNVTNYTYIDNRVINNGVRVEKIGRAVGHTIPRYRVAQDDAPDVSRGGKVRGQDFVVYRADPVRGRNSRGRDSFNRDAVERDSDNRDADDRDSVKRDANDRGRGGRVTEERDPRGQDARDDWRDQKPQDRAAPPGHDNRDRNRDDRDRGGDDRPGRPGTEADTPENQPGETQAPPARAPQRFTPPQSGGSNQGGGGPNRSSDPGTRQGATTPPGKTGPAKGQPAQESARDKAKPGGNDASKGRKPKPDAPKSDKPGHDRQDDDKQKENEPDSGN